MELKRQMINEHGLRQCKVGKRDSKWAASVLRSALGPLNFLGGVCLP